jgi:hypothetical protein
MGDRKRGKPRNARGGAQAEARGRGKGSARGGAHGRAAGNQKLAGDDTCSNYVKLGHWAKEC